MEITRPNLDALRTDFTLQYQTAYEATETFYQRISSEISSKSKSNTYGWIASQLVLRQWLGPRVAQNLSEHDYTLKNQKYEGTVELLRDDLEDDILGVFEGQALPGLAEATRKHPDTLLAALLAQNPNGYDGVSFFNTSHPAYNSGVAYSNDIATTGSGGLLTGDIVSTVFADMASYIGENGLPLKVRPSILMVPPQREKDALVVMQSTTYAVPGTTGASATVENVLKGWAEVLVVPELAASPTVVYFVDARKPIKPFVYQKRTAPEFVAKQDPSDPKVFEEDVFQYGVRIRDNVGVSLPFLCARVTLGA